MAFVPKIISGGRSNVPCTRGPERGKQPDSGIVDITRLSRAFFKIRSPEDRLKIIDFLEDLAEQDRSEHW